MNCEVNYCIYNRDWECLFDEIEIDPLGMCEDCVLVSIPFKDLERLKEEQFADMESRGFENR